MTTAIEWRAIKRLDEDANRVGMKVVQSMQGCDLMALIPNNESLPLYTRDAELAVGTIEHLQSVIQGWNKAHEYISALKLIDKQKIIDAEISIMQDRVAHTLKTGLQMERIKK